MDSERMANLLAECESILVRLERDGPTPELRHEIAGYREAVLGIKKASSKVGADEPAGIKKQLKKSTQSTEKKWKSHYSG